MGLGQPWPNLLWDVGVGVGGGGGWDGLTTMGSVGLPNPTTTHYRVIDGGMKSEVMLALCADIPLVVGW